MVAPGGTVVVSVVKTIVLGGRDGGGHSTIYIGTKFHLFTSLIKILEINLNITY